MEQLLIRETPNYLSDTVRRGYEETERFNQTKLPEIKSLGWLDPSENLYQLCERLSTVNGVYETWLAARLNAANNEFEKTRIRHNAQREFHNFCMGIDVFHVCSPTLAICAHSTYDVEQGVFVFNPDPEWTLTDKFFAKGKKQIDMLKKLQKIQSLLDDINWDGTWQFGNPIVYRADGTPSVIEGLTEYILQRLTDNEESNPKKK